MALFIPGAILTLSYASLENHLYNSDQFEALFFSTFSLWFLLVNFVGMVVSYIASEIIIKMYPTLPNEKEVQNSKNSVDIEMDASKKGWQEVQQKESDHNSDLKDANQIYPIRVSSASLEDK